MPIRRVGKPHSRRRGRRHVGGGVICGGGAAVASGPFFTDTFTEASEVALSAHTADTGETWTTSSADFLVGAGDGFARGKFAATYYGWVDLGSGNGNVDLRTSVYDNNTSASRSAGVVIRATDVSNLLSIGAQGNDVLKIEKLVGGSLTTLATAPGISPSPSGTTLYELRVIVNGAQIDCYWDGSLVLQHTLSDPGDIDTFPATLTKAGISVKRVEPRISQLDAYTL